MSKKNLNDISSYVCKTFDVSLRSVKGNSRKSSIVKVRHLLMNYFRKNDYTFSEIGDYFNTDHSTVINACKKDFYKEISELFPKEFPVKKVLVSGVISESKKSKYDWLFAIVGAKCKFCGFDDWVEVHHIIPKREGGGDNIENLIVVCPNHHALIHAGLLKTKGE